MQVSPPRAFFSWQSPVCWAIFLAAALIAALAALKLMFVVAPGLNVDIAFSRDQAVAAAQQFQLRQFPDLKTDRSAVVFVSDRGLQNYVELEAGGVDRVQVLTAVGRRDPLLEGAQLCAGAGRRIDYGVQPAR